MRTPLFLLVGFLLLAACALLGRLFSSNYAGATFAATLAFVVLADGDSGRVARRARISLPARLRSNLH